MSTSEIILNADGIKTVSRMLFDTIYSNHGIEWQTVEEVEPRYLLLRLLRETGFQNPPPRYIGTTDSGYRYGKPPTSSFPLEFYEHEGVALANFFDSVINTRLREDGYIDKDHESGGSATRGTTPFKHFDGAAIRKAFEWMQASLVSKSAAATIPEPGPKKVKDGGSVERIRQRHVAFCNNLGIDHEKYKGVPLGKLLEEVLRQAKVVVSKVGSPRKASLFDIDGQPLYKVSEAAGRPTKPIFLRITKGFNREKLKKIINGETVPQDFQHPPFVEHYEHLGRVIKDDYKFTEQMFSPAALKKWGIELTATATKDGPKNNITEEPKKASIEIKLANGYYMNPGTNPRFEKDRALLISRMKPHFAGAHFTNGEEKQISVRYEQRKENGGHYAVAVLEAPEAMQDRLDGFKDRYYSGRDVLERR